MATAAMCCVCPAACALNGAAPSASSASSSLGSLPSLRPVRHVAGTAGSARLGRFSVRAAKAPPGVEAPKEQPKLPVSFWGFTENAEVWNSRAAMIGIFGILFVELFAQKGILQLLGVEIGKGLDLPL